MSAVFDDRPEGAFTTEELCCAVFGSAEKKRRVSILRAARKVAASRPEIAWLTGDSVGGTSVFFRCDNVMSYALARLKSDFLSGYSNDKRTRRRTEEQLIARLSQGGDCRSLVEPGGAWHRHVESWKAEFAARAHGDDQMLARVLADRAAANAAIARKLGIIERSPS